MRIKKGDAAKVALLKDYALTPISHTAVPVPNQYFCICGCDIAPGQPYHLFRATKRSDKSEDLFYAAVHCSRRFYALANPPMPRVTFQNPLSIIAQISPAGVGRGGGGGAGRIAYVPLTAINQEASAALTILLQILTPRPGSIVEKLAGRINSNPGVNISMAEAKALNTIVGKTAAAPVGSGAMTVIVARLASRYKLTGPLPRLAFPLLNHLLADEDIDSNLI